MDIKFIYTINIYLAAFCYILAFILSMFYAGSKNNKLKKAILYTWVMGVLLTIVPVSIYIWINS